MGARRRALRFSDCRIALLADATEYDPIVVIGEIAHMAATQVRGRAPMRCFQLPLATTTTTSSCFAKTVMRGSTGNPAPSQSRD